MLIVFSGPSGSGKSTIINRMMDEIGDIEIMKSCTTRPPRAVVDNSYHHLTEEEFFKKRDNGEFFETENVHSGIWYGTLKSSIDEVKNSNKHFVKDVDVNGAKKLYDHLNKHDKILLIFVDAPDDVLRERLEARGETDEKIATRLSRAEFERSFKDNYDLCVDNIILDEAVEKVIDFVKKAIATQK